MGRQLAPWLAAFGGAAGGESQIKVLTIGQLKGPAAPGSSSSSSSSNGGSGSGSSSSCGGDDSGEPVGVQQTMDAVFRFVGIPPHDLANVEPRNARAYSTLPPPTRARLEAFYAPYNRRLVTLLQTHPHACCLGAPPHGDTGGFDW